MTETLDIACVSVVVGKGLVVFGAIVPGKGVSGRLERKGAVKTCQVSSSKPSRVGTTPSAGSSAEGYARK